MFHDTYTRLSYFKKLLNSDASRSVGQMNLYYKERLESMPVFRVPLEYLIYNRHNGRLEAEIRTYENEHAISPDQYDEDLHELLHKLLWNVHHKRNRQTKQDLEKKGQLRPGIVSADGVIIDGNRRVMLLREIEKDSNARQYFDTVILPVTYHEDEAAIVQLETEYQIGEDSKLDYGALEKYLHVKRLTDLGFSDEEIAGFMSETTAEITKLTEIMELMDQYLEHIGCPGLYTMLKQRDGTLEGPLVDLHQDLKRIESGTGKYDWPLDPDVDSIALRNIHFDYMRWNKKSDANKSYREISHQRQGNNFLSYEDIWTAFKQRHIEYVDPITERHGDLDQYMAEHPEHNSRIEGAKARDNEWRDLVDAQLQENFSRASNSLEVEYSNYRPVVYLRRALDNINKVDSNISGFFNDEEVRSLVMEISRSAWDMKKVLERGREE